MTAVTKLIGAVLAGTYASSLKTRVPHGFKAPFFPCHVNRSENA